MDEKYQWKHIESAVDFLNLINLSNPANKTTRHHSDCDSWFSCVEYAGRYTMEYMTIAIRNAMITSNMECCLIITVERMIEKLKIKDAVCKRRLDAVFEDLDIAICAPIEL